MLLSYLLLFFLPSHGSGTGRTERHHVRPAEAAFRAHLGKPGETFGKFVANV